MIAEEAKMGRKEQRNQERSEGKEMQKLLDFLLAGGGEGLRGEFTGKWILDNWCGT